MPIPSSLIASVVSAVIEAAMQNASPEAAAQLELYAAQRALPPDAKIGVMQPPPGDGTVMIDGKLLALSPVSQFRNRQNLIIMPMSIQGKNDVVFLTDASGAVHRVWMLQPTEATTYPQKK
ncbi:MAG: hypothetical protein QMB55_14310 [Propionivibrio sp.]